MGQGEERETVIAMQGHIESAMYPGEGMMRVGAPLSWLLGSILLILLWTLRQRSSMLTLVLL